MIRDAGTIPFTKIGHINRSHGLKGEVKVSLETDHPEIAQQLEVVYLQNDRGDYIPRRIASIRSEAKGHRISFFVQFEHIADRTAAEALKGKGIFIEQEKAEAFFEDEEAPLEILDFEVIDEQGNHIGLVNDQLHNGAQEVLSIATTKGTMLVPVVEQFVKSIDAQNQQIRCCNLHLLEADDED